MTTKEVQANKSEEQKIRQSILCGVLIGFICGFVGAGGGMMLLLVLTSVLGYELKTAVGTSVFIMTFTALTGAVSHFYIGGKPNLPIMIACVISTLVFAQLGAKWANSANVKMLNRVTGILLCVLGMVMLFFWKKILSNTKPDRIFSYYESMQIRFSSLRPRKEFHPLYRKPCRLPGREMHLRYLLPRRFFEAGCG